MGYSRNTLGKPRFKQRQLVVVKETGFLPCGTIVMVVFNVTMESFNVIISTSPNGFEYTIPVSRVRTLEKHEKLIARKMFCKATLCRKAIFKCNHTI